MKLLNRSQVLLANDVVFEEVATPEWAPAMVVDENVALAEMRPTTEDERKEYGVRIRNLTGDGRGVFIQSSIEMKKKEENKEKVNFEIEMLLVAMTAVDGENKPLFTRDDVVELGTKNAAPIARLAQVAQRLSGLDKDAKEQAAKNSLPAAS